MQDTIKDLKEQMQGISLVAYEASEERHTREKRNIVVCFTCIIITLVIALIATNLAWIFYLANEKTQALRDENFALRLQASQAKQNEFLISRLGEKCPEPAYIVQPPQQVTFPTNCCGTVNYASNGCGCGNF